LGLKPEAQPGPEAEQRLGIDHGTVLYLSDPSL
jgi:hypothetical protein